MYYSNNILLNINIMGHYIRSHTFGNFMLERIECNGPNIMHIILKELNNSLMYKKDIMKRCMLNNIMDRQHMTYHLNNILNSMMSNLLVDQCKQHILKNMHRRSIKELSNILANITHKCPYFSI